MMVWVEDVRTLGEVSFHPPEEEINVAQSLSFRGIQGQEHPPPDNEEDLPPDKKESQSLSFRGIQGQEDPSPACSHQSFTFRGTQGEEGDPSVSPLHQSLSLRGTQQLHSSLFPKGRARRSPSETLLAGQTNQQATKDGLTNSHELRMVTEQPRASPTSAPSQSLPPTTRPAGAGMLSRAGLSDRLVQLSLTLCLIDVSPYALNEAEIISYDEEEPQNVTGPPLSLHSWNVLGAVRAFLSKGVRNIIASNLAFCEEPDALAKEQAGEAKYEKVPLDEKDSKEVLPNVVVVPLPNLGPLSVESRGYHSRSSQCGAPDHLWSSQCGFPWVPLLVLSAPSPRTRTRSSPVHDQEEGFLRERAQVACWRPSIP